MRKLNKISIALLVGVLTLGLASVVMAATMVNLGVATSFAVLAGTAVVNVPTSTINGDVGLSPAAGSNYSGLTDGEVAGVIYAVDATGPAGSVENPALLTTAKNDLTAAYLDAAGQVTDTAFVAGDNQLGGQTLTPGVYAFGAASSANLVGTLTLDAQGDANAVFIFKASSSLVTASGSVVQLINGASACNIFWQVTSSATLGTGSTFLGTIMALTSITDNGAGTVTGRLLARNAAVSLNNTTINVPVCAGVLGASGGPVQEAQSIPWNAVIVALAGISTLSILYSLAMQRKIRLAESV
jgi:hypothetical protein